MPGTPYPSPRLVQKRRRRQSDGEALHARRNIWWSMNRGLLWTIRSVAALVAFVLLVVLFRDASVRSLEAPDTPAPSLAQLNRAITLSEKHLDGLLREFDDGTAAQSEYYGLPLRAHFSVSDEWVLLGDASEKTSIDQVSSTKTTETYEVDFRGTFRATVTVDWKYKKSFFLVSISPLRVDVPVTLYLDTLELGSFATVEDPVTSYVIPLSDMHLLHSLRYTVRHATQEAYLYHKARGHKRRTRMIETFLEDNGYTPGFDMRAIHFDQSASLPDDLVSHPGAYEDCDQPPVSGRSAYSYRSKVCLAVGTYLALGERDAFLQGSHALHTLQKYDDPDKSYGLSEVKKRWLQGETPSETAGHLEKLWIDGVGIPKCTLLSCNKDASGIRTFVFGLLEAQLGYRHGDDTARRYADAAAALAVDRQVTDGMVRFKQSVLYRPAYRGAFLASWDQDGIFTDPSSASVLGVFSLGMKKASMPPEFAGLLPSNSETTFDGWAFLVQYRCLKYGVKCGLLA